MGSNSQMVHRWNEHVTAVPRHCFQGDREVAERGLCLNLEQVERRLQARQLVMSEVVFELANIYREQGNLSAAEHYYNCAFELQINEDGIPKSSPILEQLSLTYGMQGKYQDARRVEQMNCKLHSSGHDGRCLLRSGILCWLGDDIGEAAEYFRQYLKLAEKLRPKKHTVLTAYEMLARCLLKLKNSFQSDGECTAPREEFARLLASLGMQEDSETVLKHRYQL